MADIFKQRGPWLAAALAAGVFLLPACNAVENSTQSATLFQVVKMTGKDLSNQDQNYCLSDVLYVDPNTGAASVVADPATVTFSATLLDPKSTLGASAFNDIIVTRYVVSYQRADGKNVEGVDVPYSFEGNLSLQVTVGTPAAATFIIVREVAKQEPPLVNLKDAYPGDGIYVTAKVVFYGRDGANKAVTATGYLAITFANFAN